MAFDNKIFMYLAVILLSTKFLGMLMRKMGMPQVVGALLAGILIGPVAIGIVPAGNTIIKALSEIGVVMLMFSAGLETNIKEIKQNGIASISITTLGVLVPFAGGALVALMFKQLTGASLITCLFFGTLLTATSVGITVEALRELGKLKGKVGTSILSAAVLDDIIGIVILTIVIGMESKETSIGQTFANIGLFFVAAIVAGMLVHYFFKWLSKRFPITRRLPIFSLAVCFLFAWMADEFGIANITGAFIAGMVMSNMPQTGYVEKKIDINSYMIFSPVFFASIGLDMQFEGFTWMIFAFSIVLVIVGLLTKVIGCGIGARICKFSNVDSLRVGLGMMSRGEVGLIVANMGIAHHIMPPEFMPAAVMLIVISSLLTPIFLKMSYKSERKRVVNADGDEPPIYVEGKVVYKQVARDNTLHTYERPLDVSDVAMEHNMFDGDDSSNE